MAENKVHGSITIDARMTIDQIKSSLKQIKDSASSLNLAGDIEKDFNRVIKNIEDRIPKILDLTGKTNLNDSDLKKLAKLGEEIASSFNQLDDNIKDAFKGISGEDIGKITKNYTALDKQIKDLDKETRSLADEQSKLKEKKDKQQAAAGVAKAKYEEENKALELNRQRLQDDKSELERVKNKLIDLTDQLKSLKEEQQSQKSITDSNKKTIQDYESLDAVLKILKTSVEDIANSQNPTENWQKNIKALEERAKNLREQLEYIKKLGLDSTAGGEKINYLNLGIRAQQIMSKYTGAEELESKYDEGKFKRATKDYIELNEILKKLGFSFEELKNGASSTEEWAEKTKQVREEAFKLSQQYNSLNKGGGALKIENQQVAQENAAKKMKELGDASDYIAQKNSDAAEQLENTTQKIKENEAATKQQERKKQELEKKTAGKDNPETQFAAQQASVEKLRVEMVQADQKQKDLEKEFEELNRKSPEESFRNATEILKEMGFKTEEIPTNVEEMKQKLEELKQKMPTDYVDLFEKMQEAIKEASGATGNLQEGIEETKKELDTQTGLNKELEEFKSRIKYFFTATTAVRLLKQAIQSAFNTVKELDAVMTQTAVVTDFSVGDMWNQLPRYTAQANELGVEIKSMYEATTLFYQQGLNTKQAFELSTETMKMARIAGLQAEEATNRMTGQLRSFNMELNETSAQRVSDVYSQLAQISASNVDELSTAMTKTASIAHNAGQEFESTAAFLAQIIETTRESAETQGTQLKTVIQRFTELKKDPSEIGEVDGEVVDANAIEKALRSVGVTLRDTDGQFRDFDDVIVELSSKWNSIDKNTQRYIQTVQAGSRQQSRFIALLSDHERLTELMDNAYGSAGASQKQYEKTLESMESKLARLKNAWNEFLLSLSNSEVLKSGIDLLTMLVDGINKLTNSASLGSSTIRTFITALGALGAYRGQKGVLSKFGLVNPNSPIAKKPSSYQVISNNGEGGISKSIFDTKEEQKEQASNIKNSFGYNGEKIKIKGEGGGLTKSGIAQTAISTVIAATVAAYEAAKYMEQKTQESYYTQAEQVENISRSLETIANRQTTLTTQLGGLSSDRKTIENLRKTLESTNRSTIEWTNQLQENNSQIESMVEIYPELTKYITISTSGIKTITDEGWRQYQSYLTDTNNDLNQQKLLLQQAKIDAEQSVQINSLVDTSTVTQAELDSGSGTRKVISSVAGGVAGGQAGITSGVLLGAALGSFAPVVGTIIGAIFGGQIGLLTSWLLTNDAENDAKRGAQEREINQLLKDINDNEGDGGIKNVIKYVQDQKDGVSEEELEGELNKLRDDLLSRGWSFATVETVIQSIAENGDGTIQQIQEQTEALQRRDQELFEAGLSLQQERGYEGASAINYAVNYSKLQKRQQDILKTTGWYNDIKLKSQEDGGFYRVQTSDLSSQEAKDYLNQQYKYYAELNGYVYTNNSYLSQNGKILDHGVVDTLEVLETYVQKLQSDQAEDEIVNVNIENIDDYQGFGKKVFENRNVIGRFDLQDFSVGFVKKYQDAYEDWRDTSTFGASDRISAGQKATQESVLSGQEITFDQQLSLLFESKSNNGKTLYESFSEKDQEQVNKKIGDWLSSFSAQWSIDSPDQKRQEDFQEIIQQFESGEDQYSKYIEFIEPYREQIGSWIINDWGSGREFNKIFDFSIYDNYSSLIQDQIDYSTDMEELTKILEMTPEQIQRIKDNFSKFGEQLDVLTVKNYFAKESEIKGLFGKAGEKFVEVLKDEIDNAPTAQYAENLMTSMTALDFSSLDAFDESMAKLQKTLEKSGILTDELRESMRQEYIQLQLIPDAIELLNLDATTSKIYELAGALKELRDSADEFQKVSEDEMNRYVSGGLKREDFIQTQDGSYIYVGREGKEDLINVNKRQVKNKQDRYNAAQDYLKNLDEAWNESGAFDFQNFFSGEQRKQLASEMMDKLNVLGEKGFNEDSHSDLIKLADEHWYEMFYNPLQEEMGLTYEQFADQFEKGQIEALYDDNDNFVGYDFTKEGEQFKQKYLDYLQLLYDAQYKTQSELDKNIQIYTQDSLYSLSPEELLNEIQTTDIIGKEEAINNVLKALMSDYEGLWTSISTQLKAKNLSENSKEYLSTMANALVAAERQKYADSMKEAAKKASGDFQNYVETGGYAKGTITQDMETAISQILQYTDKLNLDWDRDFILRHASQIQEWADASGEEQNKQFLEIVSGKLKEISDNENYQKVLKDFSSDILQDFQNWNSDLGDINTETQNFLSNLYTALDFNIEKINQFFKYIGQKMNLTDITDEIKSSGNQERVDIIKYYFGGKEYASYKEQLKDAKAQGKNSSDITTKYYQLNSDGDSVFGLDFSGKITGSGNNNNNSKDNSWENDLDKQINYLNQIEREEQKRNQLQEEYNRLLKQTSELLSGAAIKENFEQRVEIQSREKWLNDRVLEGRLTEKNEWEQKYLSSGNEAYDSRIRKLLYFDGNDLKINWDQWESMESWTSSDGNEKFLEYQEKALSEAQEINSNILQAKDDVNSQNNVLLDLEQEQRDAYKELSNKVWQGFLTQKQEEIDKLSEINSSIVNANNDLLDSIRSNIDKMRQDRQNQETETDIDELRRRISYLRMDTSGGNALQIKQLEEQLQQMEQDYTDSLVDQKLDEMREQNNFAEEQRNTQIEILRAQLDYYENHFDQEWVDQVIQSGISHSGDVIQGSELWGYLESAANLESQSAQNSLETINEWNQLAGIISADFNAVQMSAKEAQKYYQDINPIEVKIDPIDIRVSGLPDGSETTTTKRNTDGNGDGNNDGNSNGNKYKSYNSGLSNEERYDFTSVYLGGRGENGEITDVINISKRESIQGGHFDSMEQQYNHLITNQATDKEQVEILQRYGKNKYSVVDAISGLNTDIYLREAQADSGKFIDGKHQNTLAEQYDYLISEGASESVQDQIIKRDVNSDLFNWLKNHGYQTGGPAYGTGIAWLDGTPSKPEYVLNPNETQAYFSLRDIASELVRRDAGIQKAGDVYYKIDLNVEGGIANDYDVDRIVKKIKDSIVDDSQRRNVNSIRLMR